MVPIPIADENPRLHPPVIVLTLIGLNMIAFLLQLAHGLELSVFDYGAIPAWVMHGIRDGQLVLPDGGVVNLHQEVPHPLTVLTSMFLHGGWLHIIGNLWFLWIFGDNVEDLMGHTRFSIFYLVCGGIAAMAQVLATPGSTIPMVGASGAIAGVLGAYIILHPHARVRCLLILVVFITQIRVPAWLLLGLWFASQFVIPASSGVAWVAHVGGFAAGALLVKLFVR